MRKVIFCLLIPFIFQQCTDELKEIDGVVASSDLNMNALSLDVQDIPHDAFTSFYHIQDNQKVVINRETVQLINIGNSDLNTLNGEFSGVWEGNFEFLNGEYEFTYFSDNNLKVMIDDEILFNGTSTNNVKQKKITQSIEGIRRLKVFYNMSNVQKLQQIINYYNGLNESNLDKDSNNPIYNSLYDGQGKKSHNIDDLKLYLNWQLLGGN